MATDPRGWVRDARTGAVFGMAILLLFFVADSAAPRFLSTVHPSSPWSQLWAVAGSLVAPGAVAVWFIEVIRPTWSPERSGLWISLASFVLLNPAIFSLTAIAIGGRVRGAKWWRLVAASFWILWSLVSIITGMRGHSPR